MTIESLLNLAITVMWGSPALLAPAWLLLEAERRWTRARRRSGGAAPLAAYLLDLLAVLGALAAVLGTVLFIVSVVVLAARRVVELLAQAVETLRANPLLLAGLILAMLAALAGVALARGWVRLPRPKPRERPASPEQPASPAPVLAATGGAPASAPAAVAAPAHGPTPTRVVGAPPAQGAEAPPHGAGMRPGPAARRAAAPPWARAARENAVREGATAPPAAAHARVDEEAEKVSTLAMLADRRRAAQADQPLAPAAGAARTSAVDQDEEELPDLAMLNNRRRPIYERRYERSAGAPVSAFGPIPAVPPAPPTNPTIRGWWRLPLAVTLVVVVLVTAGVALNIEPLAVSFAELRAEVEALTTREPALAAEPTALPAGGDSARTLAPTPTAAPQGVARVAADRLNVRASPGTNQPVVATLARGDEVLLLGEERPIRSSVWVKVRVGAVEGWVNRTYLE
ncbi:MAG TPA: SH3 domain-containing protein [Roseiflexaceae bacterium]|nr:SH3 domain-containing protein [Roseiflexaceae bacterium]